MLFYFVKSRSSARIESHRDFHVRLFGLDNMVWEMSPKGVGFIQTGWTIKGKVTDAELHDAMCMDSESKQGLLMFLPAPFFTSRGIYLLNTAAVAEDLIDKEITLSFSNQTDKIQRISGCPFLADVLLI